MKCEICKCRLLSDCQFINGKYYHNKCIEKLIEQNQKYKEVIDRLEKKIKLVKQYDFDRVGRYKLLDILKEVE